MSTIARLVVAFAPMAAASGAGCELGACAPARAAEEEDAGLMQIRRHRGAGEQIVTGHGAVPLGTPCSVATCEKLCDKGFGFRWLELAKCKELCAGSSQACGAAISGYCETGVCAASSSQPGCVKSFALCSKMCSTIGLSGSMFSDCKKTCSRRFQLKVKCTLDEYCAKPTQEVTPLPPVAGLDAERLLREIDGLPREAAIKVLDAALEAAAAAAPTPAPCPYNFEKPACEDAEPQAPRDLTAGAPGMLIPKAATLTQAEATLAPLVNVHYHMGAEHKSEEYSDDVDSAAYDADSAALLEQGGGAKRPRPGFMCSTEGLTAEELAPYNFTSCRGAVEVGKSYEVHYVHSSAGYTAEELEGAGIDGIDDGLGGAANGRGQLNPMITVQGQVFQIVQGAEEVSDLLHGWTVVGHEDSVMYPGSTTGTSHDNEICSPYAITWHVDKTCHRVSPASFDNLCKQMKDEYNIEEDLSPHGSRKLVDPKFVVKAEFVVPLA